MGEKIQSKKITFVREFSSGGVVFKKSSNGHLFLLINPAGSKRWQLPKGHIEEGESLSDTAKREAQEEGGFEVNVLKKIGSIKYFFVLDGKDQLRGGKKIFKVVTYFLMEIIKKSPTTPSLDEIAKVSLLSYPKAVEKLTFENEKNILIKAGQELGITTK